MAPLSDQQIRHTLTDGARRWNRDEDGMIVWGIVVAFLFFAFLTAFVYNSGRVVATKIETQNAADAMAYSGSVWSARSMNTVTATNHLIGELNSLYVIHHALGGRHLDVRNGYNEGTWEIRTVDLAINLAVGRLGGALGNVLGIDLGPLGSFGLDSLPFLGHKGANDILKGTYSDLNSALFQAKLTLKIHMLLLYVRHTAKLIDLAATIGKAIIAAATVIGLPAVPGLIAKAAKIVRDIKDLQKKEKEIARQYRILTRIELFARSIRGMKKTIPTVISGLHTYQKSLVLVTPVIINQAVEDVAARHHRTGFIVGDSLLPRCPLPLERSLGYDRINRGSEVRSQLMRSTYPWVAYFRRFVGPALTIAAPKSWIGIWYANWTERYSLQACEWQRTAADKIYKDELNVINYRNSRHRHFPGGIDEALGMASGLLNFVFGSRSVGNGEAGRDTRLFVVKGLNDVRWRKGDETWNDFDQPEQSSQKIDDLFCQFSVARSRRPDHASGSYFRQENPRGVVCFAQSMVYNANEKSMMTDGSGLTFGPFGKKRQPKVTWDTLNWTGFVPEYKKTWIGTAALGAIGDIFEGFGQPEIRLNWQAKLTPVSGRKLAKGTFTANLADADAAEVLNAAPISLQHLKNH